MIEVWSGFLAPYKELNKDCLLIDIWKVSLSFVLYEFPLCSQQSTWNNIPGAVRNMFQVEQNLHGKLANTFLN